jgi:hypothetical protein
MYIMAPESISKAFFINPCHQTVFLFVYTTMVARQRLCKNVTAAAHTHETKELLDASFSVRSALYQTKVGGSSQNFLFLSLNKF